MTTCGLPTRGLSTSSEPAVEVSSERDAEAVGKKRRVRHTEPLTPLQALVNIKSLKKRNFDESLEFNINLILDSRRQDQQLRVTADLPHGTGKQVRVGAFTTIEEQAQAAQKAGCDVVGGLELVELLAKTKNPEFDKVVATPEILPQLSKIGKILGPKGLMPSKKLGNLVSELAPAVLRAKAGSVEVRADRGGTVHLAFGKRSMSDDVLLSNLKAVVLCIENNKPAGVKGKKWVQSAYLKSSMGESFPLSLPHLDPKSVRFFKQE